MPSKKILNICSVHEEAVKLIVLDIYATLNRVNRLPLKVRVRWRDVVPTFWCLFLISRIRGEMFNTDKSTNENLVPSNSVATIENELPIFYHINSGRLSKAKAIKEIVEPRVLYGWISVTHITN